MKAINTKAMMKVYEIVNFAKERYNAELRKEAAGYSDEARKTKALYDYNQTLLVFDSSTQKLTDAIKEVEGRASARTITAMDVVSCLYSIETGLKIAKKALNGVRVLVDVNAQNFPKSYKYRPESTVFAAEYKNGSWRVVNIRRDYTRAAGHEFDIKLTDDAKAAILTRVERGIL